MITFFLAHKNVIIGKNQIAKPPRYFISDLLSHKNKNPGFISSISFMCFTFFGNAHGKFMDEG
jgi:hypothetical protein